MQFLRSQVYVVFAHFAMENILNPRNGDSPNFVVQGQAQNLTDRLQTRLADVYRELDLQGPRLRQLSRAVEQARNAMQEKDTKLRGVQNEARKTRMHAAQMEMRAKKVETELAAARSRFSAEIRKRDSQEEKLLRELRRNSSSTPTAAPAMPTLAFQAHAERALVVFENEQSRLMQDLERRIESLCARLGAFESFGGSPIDRLEKAILETEDYHVLRLQQEAERGNQLEKRLWQLKEELNEKTSLCKRNVETLEKWSQYVRDKDLLSVAGI